MDGNGGRAIGRLDQGDRVRQRSLEAATRSWLRALAEGPGRGATASAVAGPAPDARGWAARGGLGLRPMRG